MSVCIWLTGLPCSGKTTLADELEGYFDPVQMLDGDKLRATPLAKDLGFSIEDRNTHVMRMGYVASLLTSHGVNTICAFVSPVNEIREKVRKLFSPGDFLEVYVKASLDVCVKRDVKGMYAMAKEGKINNFTGIGSPYEEPEFPDVTVCTETLTIDKCVDKILEASCIFW